MSDTFVELDFSYDSPVLAPLADLTPPSDKNALNIPVKLLPQTMAKPISVLYEALTGKQLTDDATVFRLVFSSGRAPKLYSPAIYRKDNGLVIRWGNELIPLTIDKSSLTTENAEKLELDASFGENKIGRYDESCIHFTLSDFGGYDEIIMPFPVKRANYEEPFDIGKAKIFLKKGNADELINLFSEAKMGSGGGGKVSGDVYNNDALPQGVDIKLIRAVSRDTKFGKNFIVTAEANPEIGLMQDTNFWTFSKLKQKLVRGAIIDADHPATMNFTRFLNDKGDTRYTIELDIHWPENDNGIKLSELCANWN